MLEILEKLQEASFKERNSIIQHELSQYPGLGKFLNYVINDDCEFFTPTKLIRMMQYYDIEEDNKKLEDVYDVGEYAMSMTRWLQINTLKESYGNDIYFDGNNGLTVNDPHYLFHDYKKLKENVSNQKQHYILKKCLICLNDIDRKWFVRILCKQVQWPEDLKQAVEGEVYE